MMTEKKMFLSNEQMRQIARYEMTFRDILGDAGTVDIDLISPEGCSFTLDDLYHAFIKIKEADPYIKEFAEYWYQPITLLYESFGLTWLYEYKREYDAGPEDDALENDTLEDAGPEDDTQKSLDGYKGLLVSDKDYFSHVWSKMDGIRMWIACNDEMRLSEMLPLDGIIEDMERYFRNKDKPIEEREFSQEEMESYIWFFDNDEHVKRAGEEKLALARRFIDTLCAQENALALRIKGYACYGGSRLYPCDWNTSRDCVTRLFEMKDDPQYANTLGYIYYYGRCNGGVPEYDKAFYYFGIAAANGLYEGMYKLADMFWHGYGCRKSQKTANSLYQMVYGDSIGHFLHGDHANFADAALRMGHIYAKEIAELENIETAYYYYLQADYAAKLQAQESDFFGNTTVAINARKALEEMRDRLPEDYFEEYMDYEVPHHFGKFPIDNNKCELTRTINAGGHIELTARRIPTRSVPSPENILITICPLSFCERTDRLSLTLDDAAEVWFKEHRDSVRFDFCRWNYMDSRYEFYYDDELVAWTKSRKYRFYGTPKEEPHGPEYRLVSVRFSASGRTYDYISEDSSVQTGDHVIVDGYDGETEVEVIKVAVKRESELGISVERYKRIVRKGILRKG